MAAFVRAHHRPFLSFQRLHFIRIVLLVLLLLHCTAFCPSRIIKSNRALSHQLAATSSKDLKEQQRGRPPHKRRKKPKQNAVQRLARAAANAAALYPPVEESPTSPPAGGSLGNLRQLTRTIDQQLIQNQQKFAPHISLQPQDSMSSLLEYNDELVTVPGRTVALVFGKALHDDQVTCEYAARIRALVRLLLDDESDIDVVCFSGGISGDNHVSNADAGYIFFRHLCASQGVNLGEVDVYIDRTSKDEATALHHVVKHIQTYYVPDWFQEQQQQQHQESTLHENDDNEFGANTAHARTKLHIHYSLISTGYHLCNLNDIHHRSPGQSLLRPVELQRQDEDTMVETSWSYEYATYPYLYTKDDAIAFTAKCFLLGEELVPLLINLQGVVQEKEFFQRDNYLVLASIRRALVSQMEELYKTKPTLRSDLRTPGRDVNVALEGVVLSLGRCIDLVRPAGLLVGSVSKVDFKKALRALEHAVSQIRAYCDPDAPLDPSEWGMLNTGEDKVTTHERLYTQLDDSLLEDEEEEAVILSDEEVVIVDDD